MSGQTIEEGYLCFYRSAHSRRRVMSRSCRHRQTDRHPRPTCSQQGLIAPSLQKGQNTFIDRVSRGTISKQSMSIYSKREREPHAANGHATQEVKNSTAAMHTLNARGGSRVYSRHRWLDGWLAGWMERHAPGSELSSIPKAHTRC